KRFGIIANGSDIVHESPERKRAPQHPVAEHVEGEARHYQNGAEKLNRSLPNSSLVCDIFDLGMPVPLLNRRRLQDSRVGSAPSSGATARRKTGVLSNALWRCVLPNRRRRPLPHRPSQTSVRPDLKPHAFREYDSESRRLSLP